MHRDAHVLEQPGVLLRSHHLVLWCVGRQVHRSIAGVIVLPYALFRWGAGREATIGLGVILVGLAVTHIADPVGPAVMVAGCGRDRAARRRCERLARIEVEFAGELDDLSPVVGAAVFRLAQEAITNARQHAWEASQITARVAGDDDGVRLTVDDDGDSAGPTGAHRSGYGLIGMRERAVLLGGTLEAGPTAGRDWRVDVMLPRAGPAL